MNGLRTIRYYIDLRAEEQPDRIYMIAPDAGLELTYGRLKERLHPVREST